MQYVCLVYHEEQTLRDCPDSDLEAIVGGCIAWTQELAKDGKHVFSSGLQSPRSGASVRKQNGQVTVTDGPFAETKEVLAGFTILEARDLNEAISMASQLPAAQMGTVEVRPVMDPFGDLADPLDAKIAKTVRNCVDCGSQGSDIGIL